MPAQRAAISRPEDSEYLPRNDVLSEEICELFYDHPRIVSGNIKVIINNGALKDFEKAYDRIPIPAIKKRIQGRLTFVGKIFDG